MTAAKVTPPVVKTPKGKSTGSTPIEHQKWRGLDWRDIPVRETLVAILTALLVGGSFFFLESRREQRLADFTQRLEAQRQEEADQVEADRQAATERLRIYDSYVSCRLTHQRPLSRSAAYT